ncbi:hypothetical protein [Acanthopleuribacter pedis]|uniref:Uncharacterized protein n=1 Tax=Acanthopleuribacter pedis TaxID=442870 RepID=A0A8J7Q1G9_9BACT|nr:hypothetical protein [Acanthopleuribacter pedis]MBO1317259.1 hypothetical protein [Acanthopleuribacter pedis]MBO1318566.1 hypothetical protein [Acanthopleuribacter pedis]
MSSKPSAGEKDTRTSGKIERAVFLDAVQHPTTLTPAAVAALSVIWMGAFGVSPNPVKSALAGGLLCIGSWVFHYFVRGEKLAEKYAQKQIAKQQEAERVSRAAYEQAFVDIGFSQGLQAGRELERAYRQLLDFLQAQAARGTVARFHTLADDCYQEGRRLLDQAVALKRALRAVDANALTREQALWRKQAGGMRPDDAAARTLQTRIDSHQRRLDLYARRQTALQELLTECDVLEAALESAYLEAIDLVRADVALQPSQSAAANLEQAVRAARRVEDRLRGLEQGPDEREDDLYREAGASHHSNA